MTDDLGSPDDPSSKIAERLRRFGSAPIDSSLAAATLRRVRGGCQERVSTGRMKWVAAATVAGFMAGSVGLAAADVLPAPVQDVAHHALDAVGVHVPLGHQRFNDPTTCPGGPYANHGAYVRAHRDDPNAGTSPCGKPLQAVDAGASNDQQQSSRGHGKTHGNDNGQGHGKGKGNGEGDANGHQATHGSEGNGEGLKENDAPDDTPNTNANPSSNGTPTSTSTPVSSTTSAPTTTTVSTTTVPASPST